MYYVAAIGSAGVIAVSAGILTSSVVVIMLCMCCRRRSTIPKHKATVMHNVLAEDNGKIIYRNKNRVSIARPESTQFENRISIGTGRWDDLANADEVIDLIPPQFRPKQRYKPPNPPDIILHPPYRTSSQADVPVVPLRPRSTVVRGTPSQRRSILSNNYPSMSTSSITRPISEYPLSSFHYGHDSPEVVYENSVPYNREIPNRNPRVPSRERNLSHQVLPTQDFDHSRVRGGTPSEPGNLKGILYENHAKPPPIPVRKYLEEEDTNIVKTSSSWGENPSGIPSNGAIEEPVKVVHINRELHELPGYNEHDEYPPTFSPPPRSPLLPPPRREPPPPPIVPSYEPPQLHPSSANVKIPPRHPNIHPNGVHNGLFYVNEAQNMGIPPDIYPIVENHHPNGSDIPMYGQDLAQLPPKMRRYVNVTDHFRQYQPSAQELQNRQRHSIYSQPAQPFTDERHRQMRQRPMNPRIDDIRRQNDVQINFDPRMGYRPGPYRNQQPYYQPPDEGKRFSDDSDYTDLPWMDPIEKSHYYGDPSEYNPYFFRSRWSIITDSGAEEYYTRRSNSNADDYVQVRNRLPQNFRRGSNDMQRQNWRTSGADLQESEDENNQPMVVKEYPKTRSRGGQTNQNQSGDKQRTTTSTEAQIVKPIPRRIDSRTNLTKRRLSQPENLLDALYKYREEQHTQGINQSLDVQDNEKLDQKKLCEIFRQQQFTDEKLSKNLPMVIQALISICESEGGSWQRQISDREGNSKRPRSMISVQNSEENESQSSQPEVQRKTPASDEKKSPVPLPPPRGRARVRQEVPAPHSDKIATDEVRSHAQLRRHQYEEIEIPKSAPPLRSEGNFKFSEYDMAAPLVPPSRSEKFSEYDMACDLSTPPIPPPRHKKIAKAKLEAIQDVDIDAGAGDAELGHFRRRRSTFSGKNSSPCLELTESEMKWLAKSSGQKLEIPGPPVTDEVKEVTPEIRSENLSSRTTWGAWKTKLSKTKSQPFDEMKIEKMDESYKPVNQFFFFPSSYESGTRSAVSSPKFGDVMIVRGKGSTTIDDFKPKRRPPPEPPKKRVCSFDDIVVNDTMDAEDVMNAIEKKMSTSQEVAIDSTQDGTRQSKQNSLPRTPNTSRSTALPPKVPARQKIDRSDDSRSSDTSPSRNSPMNWSQKQFHTPPRSKSPQRKNIPPGEIQQPQRRSSGSPRVPIRRQSLSPHHKFPIFPTPPSSPIPVSPLALTSAPTTPKIVTTAPITGPFIKRQMRSSGRSSFQARNNSQQQRSKLTINHASSAPNSPRIVPNTKTNSRFTPKLPFNGPRFLQSHSEEDVSRKLKLGRTDLSRSGEVIHIPPEDEYAVPFDCLNKHRNLSKSQSDISRQNSTVSSSGMSSFEQSDLLLNVFSPVMSPKSNKPFSPNAEFNHADNSRFYPIREETHSPIFKMNDFDDYDYAIPVNSPLRRSKSENLLETAM